MSAKSPFTRRLLHKVVPAHFRDPWKLALRLLRTGHPAAEFAVTGAALGLLATPLDLLLQIIERKRYARAPARSHPLIFVCGPPRSGTTVLAQTLINHLPVSYFSNLTSIFPRSPLAATQIFGGRLTARAGNCASFYGKTHSMSGPNDALYLWDRWLGADRTKIPTGLPADKARDMQQFFAAWEAYSDKPLLNKCNNLIASAHLVAEALENSYFLCTTRQPLFLAQSLYKARLEINGDARVPYGLSGDKARVPASDDGIESVCRQVRFYEDLTARQQQQLGPERFWVIPYEDFCRHPERIVQRVAETLLPAAPRIDQGAIERLEAANTVKLAPDAFASIQRALNDLPPVAAPHSMPNACREATLT